MYNYYNPYQQPMSYGQRQEVIHVNGRAGAEAFQMMANSSALLLDENEPLVWLVQTDGAGYKTVSPYSITPYQPKAAPDLGTLEERIKRIEERLYESDTTTTKSRKRNAAEADES